MLYTDRPCKMKIVASLFLLSSLAVFVHAYNFNVDVGASLDGKIVHFESLRYRGWWLKSANWNGRWLATGAIAERDVYYANWSQFRIKHIGGGIVTIESMLWRNHFCDAHHSGWVGLSYSTYPNNKIWFKWKMRCTSSDMSNCVVESVRYPGHYFDNHHSGAIGAGKYNDWYTRVRIVSPKPSDYYRSIWTTENNSGAEQKKMLTLYEGTTDTTSTSNTITTSVSAEIEGAFTASASVTHEWQQVNEKTFEKQTTLQYDITIPAYTRIVLKQLTGKYGPFRVQSNKFIIDETSLKNGKRKSTRMSQG